MRPSGYPQIPKGTLMTVIAEHLGRVKASEVSVVTAKALELERQGKSIVRLSAGEPDFPTPDHVKMACIKALCDNKTKYPPVIGLPDLREAICFKLKRDNALDYKPAETIICNGAKQVLYNAMTATLNAGDEAIMPSPYWMSYVGMVQLSRATPVIVPTRQDNGFKMTAADLDKAITPKSRWLFLNSPSNPAGAVYSPDELKALAEVLRRHPHVWVISDDIYEFITYDDVKFTSLLNVAPDLKGRFLVVNGPSKAYSMTGFRVGYAAGPEELIRAMFKIQSQSTSGANHLAQWATVAALTGDHAFIARNNAEYAARRNLVVSLSRDIPGLSSAPPQGTFFSLISCGAYLGKKAPDGTVIATDDHLVDYLLNDVGVATIPGAPFGIPGYFRVSFATSQKQIEIGFARIKESLARLS
jgi:aspartate aminotransferase